MKAWIIAGFIVALALVMPAGDVHAIGLKVAPLEYRTTLKEGERKKGFIDISNPSSQTVRVRTSVQAFQQIDDDGGLRFYDEGRITAGIRPELKEFELGARQAIRMYFTVDGTKLPSGDVYAAIFFTTDPRTPTNGVGQSVRLGTLLSVVNRTPGERTAVIAALDVPFFQADSRIKGSYSIRNTGKTGGFYPEVKIETWPAGARDRQVGSLVFAGRTRQNQFTLSVSPGIHRLTVGYGESSQSRWVVMLPAWLLLLLGVLVLAGVTEFGLWYRRKRKSRRRSTSGIA